MLGNSGKWKLPGSDKASTEISSTTTTSFCSSDGGVLWASLPPNLMRHGKVLHSLYVFLLEMSVMTPWIDSLVQEVVRQRDSSLQAAIDALLEASAADKLIECLRQVSIRFLEVESLCKHVMCFFTWHLQHVLRAAVRQGWRSTAHGQQVLELSPYAGADQINRSVIRKIDPAEFMQLQPCFGQISGQGCSREKKLRHLVGQSSSGVGSCTIPHAGKGSS